ncbi:hypothetical protein HK103_000868 [Boothiomyces macroporosus]|uniref:Uncharacterized protein n=1 Tax=Boothiomyces macroporosus TaxID=261099 RepID=A0AAD5Y5M1_9FUNG|nr:hypothetical protein HK103_000868 [Boothiomyces macroporosus]
MSSYPQRGRYYDPRGGYGRPPPGYYDRRSAYPPRDYQRPDPAFLDEKPNDGMEADTRNDNLELENGEIISPSGGNPRGDVRDYPERRYPPPDRYGDYPPNRYDDGYRGRGFRGRGMSRGYPSRGYADSYYERRRYPPPPYNSGRGYPDRYPPSPERYRSPPRYPPSPTRYGMRRTPSPFSRGSRSPSPGGEKRPPGFVEERRSSVQSAGIHPPRSPPKLEIGERRPGSPEFVDRPGSPDYHGYDDRRPRSPEYRSRPPAPYPDRRPYGERYNRPVSVYNDRAPYDRRPPSPGLDRRPPPYRRPPPFEHHDRPALPDHDRSLSPDNKMHHISKQDEPFTDDANKRSTEPLLDEQIEKSFDSAERSYSQSTSDYQDSPRGLRPGYPSRPPYQRRSYNDYPPSRHQSYPQSDRYNSGGRYPPSSDPPIADRYPMNDRFPPGDRYPPSERYPPERYPPTDRFPPSQDRIPPREHQAPRDPYYPRPPPKTEFPPTNFVESVPKSPKELPKEKAQLILTPAQIELNRLLQDEQKHRCELERISFDMYRATRDVDKFDGILEHIAQELQSF